MPLARTIARIVLGLIFTFAGASAFFIAPPPMPATAGAFMDVYVHSHWNLFVAVIQLIIGLMLVSNRFVPLALVMLAAFLYNSLVFHLTMMPMTLPVPIVALALGLFIAWPYRGKFAFLFEPKAAVPD